MTQKDLRGRVGMESNWHGDGWGWIQMSAGTGGMDLKCMGTGGDGTKISSPCRPLILVPPNLGPPEKMAVKWRVRERESDLTSFSLQKTSGTI